MNRLDVQSDRSGLRMPEDLEHLLEAADDFSRQFDIDVDDILREVAATLNRRVEFDRLRQRFGVSLPRQ